MSDFDYMEKYGDEGYQLDSRELEEEQQRIDTQDIMDNINKCTKRINEILAEKELDKEALTKELRNLKEMVGEI